MDELAGNPHLARKVVKSCKQTSHTRLVERIGGVGSDNLQLLCENGGQLAATSIWSRLHKNIRVRGLLIGGTLNIDLCIRAYV
ncbi:hypothetical protein IVB56_25225 [Bradyrhizobium sp. CW7]|uniref:hypothetical protein n=1 Tax=Bradyrhizobium sp. CW7 TaxID=2782688 RepID=UPI001FF755BB|nr:hypothetical protein [Bradyrhizobium sp. CW7]MCK1354265.1 hypothetical protein [Bradyrhizobium sp. CW7]